MGKLFKLLFNGVPKGRLRRWIWTTELMVEVRRTLQEQQLRDWRASWSVQPLAERRARMTAVVELAAELQRIKAVSIFATAGGERAIEDIIKGDWAGARQSARWQRFEDELQQDVRAQYAPLWARFVEMAEARCAKALGEVAHG